MSQSMASDVESVPAGGICIGCGYALAGLPDDGGERAHPGGPSVHLTMW